MMRSLIILEITFTLFFPLSAFAQNIRENEPVGKISNATYEISMNKLTPKGEDGFRTVSFAISNLNTHESSSIEYKTRIRDFINHG